MGATSSVSAAPGASVNGVSTLHALNANTRTVVWEQQLPSRASTDPVVTVPSEVVYVGVGANPTKAAIVAVDRNGVRSFPTNNPPQCIAVGENGTIYATTFDRLFTIR